MKKNLGIGALVGGLLTAALMGIMYLANQALQLTFVPFDLFNWVARVLPGDLVTFGIDMMIDTMRFLGISVVDAAKTAEKISADLQFLGIGIVIGIIFFVVMRTRQSKLAGLVVGALFGLPMIGISLAITQSTVSPLLNGVWLLAAFLIWGFLLNQALARTVAAPSEMAADGVERVDRRKFLVRLGASTAVITVAGAGIGTVLATNEKRRRQELLDATSAHDSIASSSSPFPNANDPVVPVPGTRPEYTPIKDHYQVFLQTEPTLIEEAGWTLPITGMVDNPMMLTLDDIRDNYDAHDQYVTLTCISGRVGTGLISTTQWTGISVQDLLADLGVQDGAKYLHIMSGDGFYETVSLDMINNDERIMLCYAWDGNTLPKDHGFPLRIWLPDLYGMKQPKWITSIEVTDENIPGYWVERNWDEVAQVRTTSVIDTIAVEHAFSRDGQQFIPVGGIAYAGDRGISKVQVRVDGGSWEDAEIRTPLSETTWYLWRFEWPFTAGEHLLEVRTEEEDGTPQIEETRKNRPSGATGIHSDEVTLAS